MIVSSVPKIARNAYTHDKESEKKIKTQAVNVTLGVVFAYHEAGLFLTKLNGFNEANIIRVQFHSFGQISCFFLLINDWQTKSF